MSSLRKERGVWMYYARVGKRQIHRSLQTEDRRTALVRKKALDMEYEGKRWLDTRIPWEEFRARYEEWSRSRKIASTARNEIMALKKLTATLAPARLSDVTRDDAERFITLITKPHKKGKGEKKTSTSPGGANFYLRTLRSIFSVAVEWKLIEENPFKGVRMLTTDLPSPRILTRAEITAIFAALYELSPDYVPLVAFYLVTGMRRNEALNLQWRDVNFETGVITVARSKGRRPRLIPMAPAARRILSARRELEQPFSWYPDSVSRVWRAARAKAKLPDVKIHDLRRTFGTLLAQAGVSSLFIQNWMGHTDPSVTREHYIGLPEETKKQLKGLEGILPKGL